MKIFRRLLRITRIILLAVLAVYATAALLLNLSDPGFKSAAGASAKAGTARIFKGELHHGTYYNAQATAAGNRLVTNGVTEASLDAR